MKKVKIVALVLALTLVFAGCGSAATDMAFDGFSESESFYNGKYDSPAEEIVEEPVMEEVFDSATASVTEQTPLQGRKLIRNFNLDVETLEFDSFVASVKNEVNSLGGYIESSGVSGNSYNYTSNRSADFVCRIPSEKLDSFVNTVGGLGNVTYSYEDTTDVTLSYVDTEARIESLQTEYDRLLELLAEAENIESIIILEQRLTDVRYQLESYKSQLRTYDNLVDYSTVNLTVFEVKRITAPEQETVWERIQSDFGDNIYSIYIGAENFFVWFVANIPYFIIWAVIIAVAAIIFNRVFKNNPRFQERKAARKARKEFKKAQKLEKKISVSENTDEK